MADNFVSNPGSGGATFAADEISSILYPRGKITLGEDGSNDGDVSESNPLPVREFSTNAATRTHCSSSSVAAGSSVSLDSDTIPPGKNAKLLGLLVASSVPFKWDLKVVSNAVESGTERAVGFSHTGERFFIPPGRDFFTASHDSSSGFDGFRCIVTNLTTGTNAADVYATFFYDLVDQ